MLLTLSILLLIAALGSALSYRRDVLHPGFWTNIGFIGYAAGGLYYVAYGYDGASFLNLADFKDQDRSWWFDFSIVIVWVGYLACNAGFWLGNTCFRVRRLDPAVAVARMVPSPAFVRTMAKYSAIFLIIIGTVYWLYVAQRLSGSVLGLFRNVAAYRYLVADAGLTILPYHLAYVGIQIWMLSWLGEKRGRSIGLFFIPLGVVIILTTGRISLAGGFGLSALLAYIMSVRGCVRIGVLSKILIALVPFSLIFYFYRQMTSYVYIGKEQNFALLESSDYSSGNYIISYKYDYILTSIFGGGNIPDLQQIILIIKGMQDSVLSLAWGATYVDWISNLFSQNSIQSVGYRILNAYFPDKVGGPTPGMIGEAILNFGYFGFLALFILCFVMTMIYTSSFNSKSYIVKLLYCKFIVGTWALFIKVDSSLFLGYIWVAFPLLIAWFVLYITYGLFKKMERRGGVQGGLS